jgi:hypothetical protein
MAAVNSGSACWVTIALLDRFGNAGVPTAAQYRIDCLTSGTSVLGWTNFPSLAASVDIEVTAAQNVIVNASHPQETKRMTIKAQYSGDASDQITGHLDWPVLAHQFT